jgi:Cytochrome c/c1 heme lyase
MSTDTTAPKNGVCISGCCGFVFRATDMKEVSNDSESNSACPVNHSAPERTSENASPWRYFFPTSTTPSIPDGAPIASSTCPVHREDQSSFIANVASLEEAARHAQTPQPDQQIPLDTQRQVSSIPRGSDAASDATPAHQLESTSSNWIYPSEQQMYNAMRKKGWSNVPEESIPVVLQIHNNINERTWSQIQNWEGTTSTEDDALHLVRFQGRPGDVSPKAFLFSNILRLYDPPFDRHDWYVQKATTGRIQRYVIDFYYLPPEHPNMPPIPYIDARPALDHPYALYLHGRRFLQLAFPGIAAYVKNLQSNSNAGR